jgi:thiol-disulfide isomerase/thioredoxin
MGEAGVVHAVLFYSPSCGHCHEVIDEVLPPLQETYGEQLKIAVVDVSTPEGADLYFAAIDYFDIPSGRRGVPTMVVGYVVLVGSREIPERLPTLIEQGLDEGGVGWPAIPGFEPPTE